MLLLTLHQPPRKREKHYFNGILKVQPGDTQGYTVRLHFYLHNSCYTNTLAYTILLLISSVVLDRERSHARGSRGIEQYLLHRVMQLYHRRRMQQG